MVNDIRRLETFLRHDPDNPSLLLECTDAALHGGERQKSAEYLSRLREPDASSARARFLRATLALADGRPAEAAEGYGRLLAEGTEYEGVRHNLAYCLLLAGQATQALRALAPYDEEPDSAGTPARLLLARVHHHLGNPARARDVLRGLMEQEPVEAAVLGLMSLLELDLGNRRDAEALARRALALDSENLEARLVAGHLSIDQADAAGAAGHFSVALTRAPSEQRALMGAAVAAILSGRLQEARRIFRRDIEARPAGLASRNALAWCWLLEGAVEEAEKAWSDALAVDRNFAELHGGLAVVAVVRGETEDARIHIKRALGLDRNCYSAWFARTLLLHGEGRPQKAGKLLDSLLAIPVSGSNESLGDTLVRYLAKAGHTNNAH